MELSDEQVSLLASIISAPLAWSAVADLVRSGHAEATIADVEALGLAERWGVPRIGPGLAGEVLTLTPLGAFALGVEIDERRAVFRGEEIEAPHWVKAGSATGPIRLPRHARTYRLPHPELVPDPRPGPEVLVDDGEPVLILGVPVRIDRRLRRSRPDRRRRGRAAS